MSTKNLLQSYNVHFNSFPKLRISRVKAYIKISPCVLFIDRNTVTDRLRKSKLSIMYFNECLSSAALILHLVNANIWCISLCIQFIFVPSRNPDIPYLRVDVFYLLISFPRYLLITLSIGTIGDNFFKLVFFPTILIAVNTDIFQLYFRNHKEGCGKQSTSFLTTKILQLP